MFSELPRLRSALVWRPLVHGPTPVQPATTDMADYLGRSEQIWIKRDDLASPLYGGNKVRRYEFLLAEAASRSRLLTVGGTGSTQATATSVFGAALGFEVRAVLFDQPTTRFVRESLLAQVGCGTELIRGGGIAGTAMRTLRQLIGARDTYFVPPGASGPRANVGYFDAALELAEQVRAGLLPRPDVIVLPTGSAGTLAGLLAGARYLDWPLEIVGVRIAPFIACNRATVGSTVWRTERFLRRAAPALARRGTVVRYRLLGSAVGPGYGHPTAEAIEALPVVERLVGAPGEVTYSAKALVGLRALCRDERYEGKNILFWNTLSAARPPAPGEGLSELPRGLQRLFEGDVPA